MCDPEVASAEWYSSDESAGQCKEVMYCAGNMSTEAIGKFTSSHKCNVYYLYCEMARLKKL